ncbi:MAG: adenosylmethionine--8-amino-7-oxononanoate transaminase, partial [Shewanella sp.]
RPFANLIYIMPPYVISSAQLTALTQAMKQVAATIAVPTADAKEDATKVTISHG